MKPLSRLFSSLPLTIFSEMSALAARHNAVNLGQGFPDTDGPLVLREIAAKALIDGPNQYAPTAGLPDLRLAVAEANKRFYGLDIDASTETLVTCGAAEALSACFQGLLNPGDEVVLIEPSYDCYAPQIRAAGGVPRFVRLEPPHWDLNIETLRSAFSAKTKALVLNTPLNPIAKVFDLSELGRIAALLEEFNAYAICDEVYEHIVYDGAQHVPLMTLPGMKERCLRIGSAGKTFSMTGLRVGYVSGPAALMLPVARAHQYTTFAVPGALQAAVAHGLRLGDNYFESLAGDLKVRRDLLRGGLEAIGFDVLPCPGTYFLTADYAKLGYKDADTAFCRRLTEETKVAAIPVSAFYSGETGTPPQSLIRFCFAKQPEVLEQALENMRRQMPSL
jgi:aspartate/methionine/tyrosine aminotransferase